MRIFLHCLDHFPCLKSCGLKNGTRNVTFVRVACQAGDDPARILFPIRGVQPGKCGNEVNAAIVVNCSRERLDFSAFLNESETVTEPLHQRSGNGYASLQGVVSGLATELVRNRRKQSKV